MADINVERKKRSMLPWILGLLALALLLWALMSMLDNDERPAGDTGTDTTVVIPPTTGTVTTP